MKKIFSIALAGAALMSLVACSDASYDEKYADPSKTSTVGVPQVFTAIQAKGNTWMNPVYYRYYTQSTTSGTFSGIIGNTNSKGRFRGASEGYFDTRWQNFYDMLTQYRLLQKTYDGLSDSEKTTNKIFDICGRAMIYAQLHEMMSLWGDVPFTGAGYLWSTGDYASAKEQDVYDDDETLYTTILSDLKDANTYLAGTIDAQAQTYFKGADISRAAGDVNLWRRYINSLRLRIALHLATNGNLTTVAKAAIKEMLENESTYPMIETNDQNMGVDGDTQTDTFNYGKSFSQALHTGNYATVSSAFIESLNIPAGGVPDENSDPRVQCMLDPNPDGEYISYSVYSTETELNDWADKMNQVYQSRGIISCNYWAQVDSVALQGKQTYDGNSNLNGLWMGAAEVWLAKAECYNQGYGVTADKDKANECFIFGVGYSTEYYNDLKVNSSLYSAGNDDLNGYRKYTPVAFKDGAAYAAKIWAAKPNSHLLICTQEWLNQFVMNELEAWNIIRRTGFPTVTFAQDTQQSDYPTPPDRLPYTSNEKNYNSVNEADAEKKNYKESTGYYTPLFWAEDTYYNLYVGK